MNDVVKLSYERSVVIFDGECKFCSSSVNFIIKRDPRGHFRFLPRQSEAGEEVLKIFYPNNDFPDSLILIQNGEVFVRSCSLFRICRRLKSPLSHLYKLRFIPAFFLDPFYILLAKNRHRISGGKQKCMLPTGDIRKRFLG